MSECSDIISACARRYGELLHDDRVEEEVAAGAAVLLGRVRRREARRAERRQVAGRSCRARSSSSTLRRDLASRRSGGTGRGRARARR